MANSKAAILHNRFWLKRLAFALFFSLLAVSANADMCPVPFEDGIQVHSEQGFVGFGWNAQLIDNPDNFLPTPLVNDSEWASLKSCGAQRCVASLPLAEPITIESFETRSSTVDILVGWNTNLNLTGSGENTFRTIRLESQATLTMEAGHPLHYINELILGYGSKLNLPAGDYWIGSITLDSEVAINVVGSGRVRLYINDNVDSGWNSRLNIPTDGSAPAPQKLLIYTTRQFQLASSVDAAGYFYAVESANLANSAELYGGLIARSVNLETGAKVFYLPVGTQEVSFIDDCGEGSPQDLDGDGIPNDLDDDIDGDGFSNEVEIQVGTDPMDPANLPTDNNGNGIPDVLESGNNACLATFPNGLQSFSETGAINFGYSAQMLNGTSFALTTPTLTANPSSPLPSCGTQFCYANSSVVERYAPPEFIESLAGDSVISVPNNGTLVLGTDGVADFPVVQVQSNGELLLSSVNNSYAIRRLVVGYRGTARLPAGDYWIEELQLDSEARLLLEGGGTARLFVRDGVTFGWRSLVNSSGVGQQGDASQLLLHSYSNTIIASEATVSALIFTEQQINVDWRARIYGAVAGANIQLNSEAAVAYRPIAVGSLDFGEICVVENDTDGDGIPDDQDQFPNDPTEWVDTDNDGIGNNSDIDDDNDGVSDEDDALPLDPNETEDADNDGVGNNADTDDDNDGIPDAEDAFPFDPAESEDTDGDGVGNNTDTDDDNDGVADDVDAFPYDPDESSDTDGDGIGDNTDPDIDGDGFSNEQEVAAGTDPYNGQDYPDIVAPLLTLDQPSNIQTTNEFITLTGTIVDPVQPYSGIQLARVTNSRYPGISFDISVNGSSFSVEIPLQISHNALDISVEDLSGNTVTATINVERLLVPKFFNVTPVDGSIVTQNTITISGEVHVNLPLEEMQFFVNEYQITPNGTDEIGIYVFNLPNIPVQLGSNTFLLRAVNPISELQHNINITYEPENAEDLPAPQITLISPSAGSQLNVDSFRVAYRVQSFAGPMSIQLNGQPVILTTPQQTLIDFSELVSFAPGSDSVTVNVVATDSLNKSAATSATFYRDNQAPVIVLDNGFSVAPTLNPISANPINLSGTVTDTNLASVLINNQAVRLTPTTNNSYQFAVSLAVNAGQVLPVNIQARDMGGNLSQVEYLLENTSILEVRILVPNDGAEFISDGEPINVQLAVRLSMQLSNGEIIRAQINGGAPQLLSVSGTLATGTLNIPATSDEYIISIQVVDSASQLITQVERRVSVLNQADIPVELVRIEPEANAQFVEPNAAIEMYFNRSINVADLSVSVKETLNGQTYVNDDPLGLDFLEAEGYQLKEVNRNLETVGGQLALIPGATGVAFYPERYFGFNAELFVEISYAGVTLERTTFKVRELPTFVIGNVIDQFGQPLGGIAVSMPELGRTTVTNNDGGYAFGFQETGEQIIPGGRHRIVVNNDLQNPNYGSSIQSVNLQRNRKNTVASTTITELAKNVPFQNVASLQLNNLAQGNLILDLSAHNARVLFSQGRTNGSVHTQFLPFEHIGAQIHPAVLPQWVYGIQPRGIEVEGAVKLSIAIPAIGGSHDYIPADVYQYVVLVGYNSDTEVIEPIGIGRVENFRVNSIGPVSLQSLDFIGYALVNPANNELLQAVVDGNKTFKQMLAELQ